MEKVRPWCGQPSDRGRLRNRTARTIVLSVLSVTLVHCGQTVGWTKMKLGMQVGLGPGHIVLDVDPAPSTKKGAQPPIRPESHLGLCSLLDLAPKRLESRLSHHLMTRLDLKFS